MIRLKRLNHKGLLQFWLYLFVFASKSLFCLCTYLFYPQMSVFMFFVCSPVCSCVYTVQQGCLFCFVDVCFCLYMFVFLCLGVYDCTMYMFVCLCTFLFFLYMSVFTVHVCFCCTYLSSFVFICFCQWISVLFMYISVLVWRCPFQIVHIFFFLFYFCRQVTRFSFCRCLCLSVHFYF